MATRSKPSSRHERESDSMEALKPLVVLVLFGTILYGAYSVVQKGPTPPAEANVAAEAPPFLPPPVVAPQVELTPAVPVPPPAPAAVAGAVAAAPNVAAVPAATSFPPPPSATTPLTPPTAVAPALPAVAPEQVAAPVAGPAVAAAAVAAAAAAASETAPTYLAPQSALPPAPGDPAARPERLAALAPAGAAAVAVPAPPTVPAPHPRSGSASSAAFASAWSEAHAHLGAGRYAEALAGLSVWYDDPVLGLEESQRLEDLLGQLAGTVIYSQQDLLLPPHVVGPGETLEQIAAPLGVAPQLLAKINGVDDSARLVPGEHLKLIRGPFDAVVSISRRRLSLQLAGNYAGSFPVLVGRQFLGRVGSSLPVTEVARGAAPGTSSLRRSIVLGEGLVIESVDDPAVVSDNVPSSSLVVTVRDLDDLLDILGPGSRVLVRQ